MIDQHPDLVLMIVIYHYGIVFDDDDYGNASVKIEKFANKRERRKTKKKKRKKRICFLIIIH
jgi:hypothetical protein